MIDRPQCPQNNLATFKMGEFLTIYSLTLLLANNRPFSSIKSNIAQMMRRPENHVSSLLTIGC